MEKLENIGDIACYIQDYKFTHLCDLPIPVVIEWVKTKCPETELGVGVIKAKDLTPENILKTGWLNKLFVIVDICHGVKYAITNWDGKFSLRMERNNLHYD
jgi:hypothetical protein